MAHCPYDHLQDLEEELEEIRSWPGIREKSPGVFYVRSAAFLHFHEKEGERWADARRGKTWGPKLRIPFGAGVAARSRFLSAVREYHERTVAR